MTTRNRRGQVERDVEQATLDAEAALLRSQRLTYPQIAATQHCSVSTAFARVQRAIAAVPYEAVDQLRRIELDSLDEQERRMREVQEATHLKIDHGKVIVVEGVPVLDDAPVLHAGAMILKIKDMRAKLTGSYAPSEVKVEHTTAADAELERLAGELASRADQASPVASGGTA